MSTNLALANCGVEIQPQEIIIRVTPENLALYVQTLGAIDPEEVLRQPQQRATYMLWRDLLCVSVQAAFSQAWLGHDHLPQLKEDITQLLTPA